MSTPTCTCITAPEIDDSGEVLHASYCMTVVSREAEYGSKEWLEGLSFEERWPHTEVLAIYGDQVVNPSYDVALYHLRYAVAEVKRLKAELDESRGAAACQSKAAIDSTPCSLPVRHRGDHRSADKRHYWSDEHALGSEATR